jgi:hypothetical protein
MFTPPFERLDFLYTPSADVAADLASFERLGASAAFAIESDGTRVAAVELAEDGPLVLFADHLGGERPIGVYRVADLERALGGLPEGWTVVRRLEIPQGPCASLRSETGYPLAMYERTRPQVLEHFLGRRDF